MYEPVVFRGRPYFEWMEQVTDLHSEGRDDEALELLAGLMDAAEEDGRRSNTEVAPAYASLAAFIHQARGEHDAAVAVLERYERAVSSTGRSMAVRMWSELREARRLASEGPVVENSNVCPACGVVMNPPIKRSGKCKDCGVKVLLRKHRGVRVLRTEQQEAAFLADEERRFRIERVYMRANRMGIPDPVFEERWRLLNKKYQTPAPIGDVFWSLANERLFDAAAGQDALRLLPDMYREMAGFLADEGREWVVQAREAVRFELKQIARFAIESATVEVRGCQCPQCLVEKPRMTLGEAIESGLLPHIGCTQPPCICSFYEVR